MSIWFLKKLIERNDEEYKYQELTFPVQRRIPLPLKIATLISQYDLEIIGTKKKKSTKRSWYKIGHVPFHETRQLSYCRRSNLHADYSAICVPTCVISFNSRITFEDRKEC